MLSKKIKTMLSATAAIRDALINADADEMALTYLAGSAKSDECDRLLSKVGKIHDAIELHLCNVSRRAAFAIHIALIAADTAEIDAHGFDNMDLLGEFSRLEKKAGETYHALQEDFLAKLQSQTQTDTDQSEVVA